MTKNPHKVKTFDMKTAEAALKLAARKPWSDMKLEAVAKAAKIPLPSFKKRFSDKNALLPVIIRYIDHETAKNIGVINHKTPVHDRLFEVMMARFDVLQAHRLGITSIAKATQNNPVLFSEILKAQSDSMHMMLRLARLDSQGIVSLIQHTGLFLIYQLALQKWLKDDSPDMTKTMSTIDRSLRTAGKIMEIFHQ